MVDIASALQMLAKLHYVRQAACNYTDHISIAMCTQPRQLLRVLVQQLAGFIMWRRNLNSQIVQALSRNSIPSFFFPFLHEKSHTERKISLSCLWNRQLTGRGSSS